ncbi:MAG: hypothetical protein M9918_00605 [Anaerolineae bacterium]|nr:hypothetical protein [Anaerolineae bacterium]
MRRLILSVLLLGVGWIVLFRPIQAQSAGSVADLWIDFSLGPPLVDLFNEAARPDDIARIENISQIRMLENVTTGRRLVVFKSVEEAAEFLPRYADEIDIVGYNLENGLPNPAEEQADPVASVQRMRELVDQYDLELMMGPDRQFALEYGSQMAPFVDLMVLQVQRAQTEPQTVIDFVVPMVQQLRAANPDIEISMQIRTEGDVTDLIGLTDMLKGELDGLSILTSLETTATATELLTTLRPPASDELTEEEVAQLAAERQALEAEGLAAAAGENGIVIQPIPSADSDAGSPADNAAQTSMENSAETEPTSTSDADILPGSGNASWILAIVGVLILAAAAAAFLALRTDTPTRPKGRI